MREIQLTQGQVATVDDEDYEKLAAFKWSAHRRGNTFYAGRAKTGPKKGLILMHRVITGVGSNLSVDHIDGNGLNNCHTNLRLATHKQNLRNQRKQEKTSSRFKGVCWRHDINKWMAYITADGKRRYLGHFHTEQDAAAAYDDAAAELFGSFANKNIKERVQ